MQKLVEHCGRPYSEGIVGNREYLGVPDIFKRVLTTPSSGLFPSVEVGRDSFLIRKPVIQPKPDLVAVVSTVSFSSVMNFILIDTVDID